MARSSVLVEHECPTARGRTRHGIHPWGNRFRGARAVAAGPLVPPARPTAGRSGQHPQPSPVATEADVLAFAVLSSRAGPSARADIAALAGIAVTKGAWKTW